MTIFIPAVTDRFTHTSSRTLPDLAGSRTAHFGDVTGTEGEIRKACDEAGQVGVHSVDETEAMETRADVMIISSD